VARYLLNSPRSPA